MKNIVASHVTVQSIGTLLFLFNRGTKIGNRSFLASQAILAHAVAKRMNESVRTVVQRMN